MIVLYLIGGVGLLIALLGIVLPKTFAMERSIVVARPVHHVFDFLMFVKNHDAWNPWSRRDPAICREFKGQDGSVGFTYSWSGPKAGAGEQEILKIDRNKRIDFELRFREPFVATNTAYLTTRRAKSHSGQLEHDGTRTVPHEPADSHHEGQAGT